MSPQCLQSYDCKHNKKNRETQCVFSALLCPFTWEFSSIEHFPVGDVSIHTFSPEACPVAVFSTWEIHSKGLCWSLLLRRLTKKRSPATIIHHIFHRIRTISKAYDANKRWENVFKSDSYSYLQVLYRYSNSTFYIFRIISNCKNVNKDIGKRFQKLFPCSLSLH